MDDLRVGDVVIPAAELRWRFSTSGGPGGQHANRVASRAELRFDPEMSSALAEPERELLASRLGVGEIVVVVDETRSQWRNRQTARHRLASIVSDALRPDPEPRKPTRPSRSARQRRLTEKRARSRTKQLRRKPPPGED